MPNFHFLASTVLKNAFDAFDHEKKGVIATDMIGTILEMLGHELDEASLNEIISEVDQDGKIREDIVPNFAANECLFSSHWRL